MSHRLGASRQNANPSGLARSTPPGSAATEPATRPATLGPTFFKLSATFFLAASAGLIAAGANIAGMAMALTMPRRGWRERG